MELKQCYETPDILVLQMCPAEIVAGSLPSNDNEKFGDDGEFVPFGW